MATRDRFEEAIRLYVETAGDEELKALVASLGDLGDTADFQAGLARKAMERFGESIEQAARVDAFRKLKQELVETEAQLEQAQAGAQALFAEFNEGDSSNSRVTALQRDARKAVDQLSGSVQRQRAELQRLRQELAAGGIDTRQLGSAQAQLKQQMATARQALEGAAKSVAQFRAESAKAAADVPARNREIAQSYTLIERGAGRLRGILAGVGAYLGLQEAVQGIRNLAGIGAAAENAQRALSNLYGSQEAGNRAYAQLKTLAKENGLAFDTVYQAALKLKAFGLDPLNGSMQALIDQNAAVGGSQQDLEGKVLALGQAWAKQKLQGEEILQLVERGVPVWDLLQKSTGKSVAELQKLSEQGKLGRDVIRGLYEEIGKANSGAAERGLSGLSGLLAQASARWQDFLQRVADAGVTDYFKQQIQSLLGSTGNLDALAKRVADGIISTLEALKRLGQQIALIAQPIASTALQLARHAEAVVLLGKVYAGLKLLQLAEGFAGLAKAQQAATAATVAATAAEATRATGIGRLGSLLASLPRTFTVAIGVVGLDFALSGVAKLNEGLKARQEAIQASSRLEFAQRDLQLELIRIGQQQQELYRGYASTVIQSGQQVSEMTREQAGDYQFALEQARQYYAGVIREARATGDAQKEATATERWKLLGQALEMVQTRVKALGEQAAKDAGLTTFVDKAVAKFDQLIAKGKSVKDATSGIFDGIDFTRSEGLSQAVGIFEQIQAKGGAAGKAIQAELRTALAGVAAEDLPQVKAAAEAAFGSGTAAAKQFAAEVDRINLTRLGVDVEAIKTGFTDVGRAAVDGFRGAINEVDQLGLTMEQRSVAVATAFDNAFKQASTKQEVQALKAALQEAMQAGNIGFGEFQQRVAQVDAKLAELGGTGQQMGRDVASGASQAAGALDQVAGSAESAAQGVDAAGEAAERSREGFEAGSKAGQQFALSLFEVSQKAMEAYMATNRLAGSPLWARTVNDVTDRVNDQGKALQEQLRQLEAANAEFDESAALRQSLSKKYDLLGAGEVEKLVQAQQRLVQNQERAAQQAQRQREEFERAAKASQQIAAGPTVASSGTRAAVPSGAAREVIRFELPGGDSVDLYGSAEDVDAVGEFLRQLARSQSVATRRRRS